MSRPFLLLITVRFILAAPAAGQDRDVLVRAFDAAAAEFDVPADILKALSFEQTR